MGTPPALLGLAITVKDAAIEAQVDNNTACDVYMCFREVFSTTLLNMPIILGGPGKKVVQLGG